MSIRALFPIAKAEASNTTTLQPPPSSIKHNYVSLDSMMRKDVVTPAAYRWFQCALLQVPYDASGFEMQCQTSAGDHIASSPQTRHQYPNIYQTKCEASRQGEMLHNRAFNPPLGPGQQKEWEGQS